MADDIARLKWHSVGEAAASALTSLTNSPGVIYPVGSNALPPQLQNMPGVSSYYVSAFANPQPLSNGLTVGGEMLVARSTPDLTKNYLFAFATGSGGNVYYAGPFKGQGHHVSSGQVFAVNSMFNQTPFSTKP